jgi:predicted lipid-binding transport protein (Tim44 family)
VIIFFDHPTRLIGSRGSRRSAGVRSIPVAPEPPPSKPSPVREIAPPALPVDTWLTTLTRLLRGRDAAPAKPTRAPFDAPPIADTSSNIDTWSERAKTRDDPSGDSGLERGLRDIRRTDPGFDPSRFVGYAGMVFRDAQSAWMARDFASLRERVTAEMYGALQAQCTRVRSAHRVNRVTEIEITAVVTEAWQEGGRDYVTAHIGGSMVDYTVDEMSDRLVDGSRTIPRAVEEFWTFARPAGLNFWMLSAIQA